MLFMVQHPFSMERRRIVLGLGGALLAPACTASVSIAVGSSSSHSVGPLVSASPEQVGMRAQGVDGVFARLNARARAGRFPGAVAIICRHGKIVGEHAVGHRVRKGIEPMTADTLFDLMSITKVMSTAISAMVLVDQGKLKLDDPVVKHLPGFVGKNKERVLVRHMLSYAAGLPLDNNVYEGSPDEIWQKMAATNLQYEPGTKVEYSDLTYRLLGKLLEHVAGKRLDEFAREHVWKPLGMTNTTYTPSSVLPVAATGPSERRRNVPRGVVQDDQDFILGGVVGCDGLFSTAKDVAVFGQMILNGGIYDGERILSPALVAEMVKNQTPFVDVATTDTSSLMNIVATPKGYGWELATPRYSNGGTRLSPSAYGKAGASGTFVWIDPPRQLVAVLLTNHGLPIPIDESGWNRFIDDVGSAEFFNGVIDAIEA